MDLLRKFRLAEIDQAMSLDDNIFVNMLNKIRTVEIDQECRRCYQGRRGRS